VTPVDVKERALASSVERQPVLFICYRRDDTPDAAGRLHDNLANAYGAARVFMDVDNVPLGADFVEHVTARSPVAVPSL
jgi:hypothetical protein